MKPIRFSSANAALTAPPDWDEEANGPCEPLPVLQNANGFLSVWVPTEDELASLNAGGGVYLTVSGKSHPVVQIGATELTPPETQEEQEEEADGPTEADEGTPGAPDGATVH